MKKKKTKKQEKATKKDNRKTKNEEEDLLKRLATYHRTSVTPSEEKDEIKSAFNIEQTEGHGATGDPELPEWFEDINSDNEAAFKELFDMLDSAQTGVLNAENLLTGLQRVDSGITREEVDAVIQKLDKDGNGEIDFDEFLIHMTTGDLLAGGQEGSKKGFSRRQRLFYTAITQYTMKNKIELGKKRQPHVIGHYAAGFRLEGLTDKQLTMQMRKLQRSAKKDSSPYAQPLPFVTCKKSRFKIATQRRKIVPVDPRSQKNVSFTSQMYEGPGPDQTLDAWKHQWKYCNNIGKTDELVHSVRAAGLKSSLPEHNAAKEQKETVVVIGQSNLNKTASFKNKRKSVAIGKGVIPHVGNSIVPLPVLRIKYSGHRPTIDDLPNIREQAKAEMDVYYEKLRIASVKNAYEHWDKLYADTIRPKKLLENFRIVYRAYSPHKEDEAFVVCPWMRGPYSYFKRKVDSCVRPFSAGQ